MTDEAFLAHMLAAAEAGATVTAAEVARLRRLADWADAPLPPCWSGTVDPGEVRRAVDAARLRQPVDTSADALAYFMSADALACLVAALRSLAVPTQMEQSRFADQIAAERKRNKELLDRAGVKPE